MSPVAVYLRKKIGKKLKNSLGLFYFFYFIDRGSENVRVGRNYKFIAEKDLIEMCLKEVKVKWSTRDGNWVGSNRAGLVCGAHVVRSNPIKSNPFLKWVM